MFIPSQSNQNERKFSEAELSRHLFQNYSRYRKPRINASDPVIVEYQFSIYSISEIDLERRLFISSSSMAFWWHDEHLIWENDEKFSNVSYFVVQTNEIWLPSFIIANSIPPQVLQSPRGFLVGLRSNGWVEYYPVAEMATDCNINLRYWPFDVHNCSFIFTSYSHTSDQLIFIPYADQPWNFFRLEDSKTWQVVEHYNEIREQCFQIENKCFPVVCGLNFLNFV